MVLGALVVIGFVFAWPLVQLLAPGFEKVPGKLATTVALTRLMLPFLPLVSFAAVTMGMLNAEERYAMPAVAPAMFNVVTIGWAVAAVGDRASGRRRSRWAGPSARCWAGPRSS